MTRKKVIQFLLVITLAGIIGKLPAQKIDFSKVDFNAALTSSGTLPPTIDSQIIESAKQGDAESQYRYGIYLRKKFIYHNMLTLDGPDDGDDALIWFEAAASQGHTEACIEAGILYYDKFYHSLFKELYHRKAVNYIKQGGGDKDPQMLVLLGRLANWEFRNGEALVNDGTASLEMLQKAIDSGLASSYPEVKHRRGHASPCLKDAYAYMAFIHKNNGRASECLYYTEKAVSEGDCSMMLEVGEYYYTGYGTKVDRDKAERIWNELIKERPYMAKDVNEIKAKASGQIITEPKHERESEESKLRKLLLGD